MLTFDKIRDLERGEREGKQLQKLPANFMDEIKEYLRKKEASPSDAMELENVRSTIKRFFELREKKIVDAALYSARTGMPIENLLKEEEGFLFALIDDIRRNREIFFSELQKEPVVRQKITVYKVRRALPAFVGPDMNTYKLNENDEIQPDALPRPLNDFLLKKGIIEKVEQVVE